MKEVNKDNTVKVHYTGKLENGEVFDTSENKEPLEFKVGEGKLIPGFEEGVVGMKENESKTIKIPSKEAYDPVRDELRYEVEKDKLPENIEPKQGMQLVSKQPDGQEMVVTVDKVQEDKVVINANHPLAGKDLTFDIKVVDIK